jgi:hypothetical protein
MTPVSANPQNPCDSLTADETPRHAYSFVAHSLERNVRFQHQPPELTLPARTAHKGCHEGLFLHLS